MRGGRRRRRRSCRPSRATSLRRGTACTTTATTASSGWTAVCGTPTIDERPWRRLHVLCMPRRHVHRRGNATATGGTTAPSWRYHGTAGGRRCAAVNSGCRVDGCATVSRRWLVGTAGCAASRGRNRGRPRTSTRAHAAVCAAVTACLGTTSRCCTTAGRSHRHTGCTAVVKHQRHGSDADGKVVGAWNGCLVCNTHDHEHPNNATSG